MCNVCHETHPTRRTLNGYVCDCHVGGYPDACLSGGAGKILLMNETDITTVNITNAEMAKMFKQDTFVVITEVEMTVKGIRATDTTTVSVIVNSYF